MKRKILLKLDSIFYFLERKSNYFLPVIISDNLFLERGWRAEG